MALIDRVKEKEASIKIQLDTLRTTLNEQRKLFNQRPQEWGYFMNLVFVEKQLDEMMKLIQPLTVPAKFVKPDDENE